MPEEYGPPNPHPRPWHLLTHDHVDDDVAATRLALCEGCEHYMITKQCKKCFCFMPAKVKLAHAFCPVDKWGVEVASPE